MAAQPCPQLVSYDEFVELAERSDENLELHFGQVVDMGRPVARSREALKRKFLLGSPEIVVEVFSPDSNTIPEMAEKASLCLGTGTVQFWVVDERFSIVTVTTSSGTRVYATGERIPLGIADASLAVDEIFA